MSFPRLLRSFLWPLSLVYGGAVRARVWMYQKGWLKQRRLEAAVISVGNLTVGGTGKTPMVIWLAEKFLADGKRVGILSRGYRGSNGTSDEIELMKFRLQGRVAFGVGKDRFAAGKRLESQQPIDIFLLDDGFQHLQLARDLDILLMDASRPMQGEFLLPAGRLREPLSAMSRANLVVFSRAETVPGTFEAIDKLSRFPVFGSATRLLGFRRFGGDFSLQSKEQIGVGPFFAFCGLGNPDAFFRDLRNWGLAICGQAIFPDHYRYRERDILRIKQAAKQTGANAFVTTEKDAQNLLGRNVEETPLYICVIDLVVSPEADFRNILDEMLAVRTRAVA
ncbi:MAG: tetraacyldisaccharide 4'-kinase [Acidobacteria bacterium]|nr:MAG: tetraacyldisaccharide 4'-kinase [Acidobacteria bacterium 13_1_40CM_4_58_4]PYT63835.1 MAG: tetraacyldisaccharide 4'-kinase [Acidobacteriota bacterium]